MFDIIIRGAEVIDGSGAPRFTADIGLIADRIAAIGNLENAEALQEIEAAGKIVAPGFIDIHSHSDYSLPFLPTADSKVHQGITLEVVGNCGSSMAPFSSIMSKEWNETAQVSNPSAAVTWNDFSGFIQKLRGQGISLNVASLVGHGTIREKVMGMTDAPPTPTQLADMQEEVRKAIEAGAVGLSTGLIYTPNVYAQTDEIVALARITSEMGGLYTSHVRGEANTLIEALQEAITVGHCAEISVQISHLKASGIRNWHKMPQAIEVIEKARAQGLDITADMYPYPASNTGLDSLIPAWVHVGGLDEMIRRMQQPAVRARVHAELADPLDAIGIPYDRILISSCPTQSQYEGRDIQEIADSRKQSPLDAVLDILIETRLNAEIIEFSMQEENVALGLQQPFVMIGSDAEGRSVEGPYSAGKPHPRSFGTFPRVLGKYARQEQLFSLEEAVRKMTSLPARKLNLRQRGQLQSGFYADLVIFDPGQVLDTATFAQPHHYPVGIEWVIVNGCPVIEKGQHSGAKPGQVITL